MGQASRLPLPPFHPPSPNSNPGASANPPLPPGLSAADVPAYDTNGDGTADPTGFAGGGCHLYIVQFWTQAIEEYRQGVMNAGGEGTIIRHFMPHHGYVVHVPSAAAAEAITGLPFVRHVMPYHPAYRFDHRLMEQYFGRDGMDPTRPPPADAAAVRYNMQVFEHGERQKEIVVEQVRRAGGEVYNVPIGGSLLTCWLTPGQLRRVLELDEITYCDEWAEASSDMDVVRKIGGADYLSDLPVQGFNGEGVRGEVVDNFLYFDHVDFASRYPISHVFSAPVPEQENVLDRHGTRSYGIIFGDGSVAVSTTGMLPSAQGFFSGQDFFTLNRFVFTQELVNPSGPYTAVFQSNSFGTGLTTDYTNISSQMDAIAFATDLLICQSQGNEGLTFRSRPEAWAKNIVSVGGIKHTDSSVRADHCWNGCDPSTIRAGSTGPAADGRIKPDLSHFYDNVMTSDYVYCPANCTPACSAPGLCDPVDGDFTSTSGVHSGTSAATPSTAGHFGLLFQMWHEEVFTGFGGAASVFDSRPHMSTAKAMLINTAYRYDWYTFPAPNPDITRFRQGWGMANLHDANDTGLYDLRENLFIFNENPSQLLTSTGHTLTYSVECDGTIPLKATLVYTDPPGTTSATLHRINNLSLYVSAPNGTGYWGNSGLEGSNWSSASGNYDSRNTVENVFIQYPAHGTWTVKIICHELVGDSHTETSSMDADFALVVSGVASATLRSPDWDNDGCVSLSDFVSYFNDFMQGDADIDRDRITSSIDMYAFLNAFFASSRPVCK